MTKRFGAALFAAILLLASCKKDNEETNQTPDTPANYATGVFFINEGNYGANNASIAAIDSKGTLHADAFYEVNGQPLGDVLQSATWIDGKIFAVLNNSGKIEVINATSFSRSTTIAGLNYPRYLTQVSSDKAYLTQGALAGTVEVIDLNTNQLVGSIGVGFGPEQITLHNGKAIVCNSGGWSRDSTVTIINTATNSVDATVEVGNRPLESVVDYTGNIWVLCSGDDVYNEDFTQLLYSTPAQLIHLSGSSFETLGTYPIGNLGDHPRSIAISNDGKKLFVANNGIFEMNLLSPESGWVQRSTIATSTVDVHVATGDVWATSISDFVNPSNTYRYGPSWAVLSTFSSGIGTSAVVVR